MSDIQCAARFLIVRHAESGADQGESASGPGLTERGIAQARALGEQLRGARIADVFTSTMPRAQQTGEHIAAQLGTTPAELPGVQEYATSTEAPPGSQEEAAGTIEAWWRGDLSARLPQGESGLELVGRFAAAIEDCADTYRGETVLVVSHGGVMALALARLTGRPDVLAARWVPYGGLARVDVDADGWALHEWPGSAEPSGARQAWSGLSA